jgi:glycosyltransferase involved in cell wall biosynthesis
MPVSKQHVLIIGTVWPEPASSAAGSRMMQFIELFKNNNWKVTFASAASKSEYMVDLEAMGIDTALIQLNNASFDSFITSLNPTIVLFDRFIIEEQFGWRVSENCPNVLKLLDTVDLHCLRYARQKALKEKRIFNNADLLSDHAKREIASIYRCDLTIMISSFEMDLLRDFFKINNALIHYTPFMLDAISDKQIHAWKAFEERAHFITIGNFLHEPNWDSVQWLKSELWPKIKKQIPVAEMHVYGAYPAQKHFQLSNIKEGFIIKGRAEDAMAVMSQAKVCIAPLRFGAGLKGKLIDAMLTGTPSVTTSIGAEGMHGDLAWNGAVADKGDDIVNAAIDLYTNKNKWMIAQQQGVTIINTCFNKQLWSADFIQKINTIIDNLYVHRLNNFTGAMLTHHTMQSTKFMSKWIEEKNK